MFEKYVTLVLPDEERARLKAEFDSLDTIDQKYKFWEEKFNYDYSFKDKLDLISTNDFVIHPKNSIEIEELNKRFFIARFGPIDDFKNQDVEKRKIAFEQSINIANDKEARIEYEIKAIDEYLLTLKIPTRSTTKLFGSRWLSSGVNPSFWEGYDEYFLYKREFNWSEKLYDAFFIASKLSGIEWAKYREFVKSYLKLEKSKQEIKLSGEQKVLALLYLGFGNDTTTAIQKADLYEYFIDNFKSKSIQKIFNSTSDYENEKNLDVLIDFFRSLKLNSKARLLEDKLEKIKQKRQRK